MRSSLAGNVRICGALIAVGLVISPVVGCGGDEESEGTSTPEVSPTPVVTPTPEPEKTPTPVPPTPTPYPIGEALVGDIVITEIMVDPQTAFDEDGEWFEVTSLSSDEQFDLDGWKLTTPSGGSHTIDAGGPLLIPPLGSLVLGANLDLSENGGLTMSYGYTGISFPNSGKGGIAIANENGVLDEVKYDLDAGFPDLEGHSMSLSSDKYQVRDNDAAGSWCASFKPEGAGSDFGTPAEVNGTCASDIDGDSYPSDQDCNDNNADINPSQAEVPNNLKDDDCDTTVDEPSTYPVGALVITEILYNPGLLDDKQAEWFEIYNTTATTIPLRGWVIGDRNETHPITGSAVAPPRTRILLGLNSEGQTNGGVYLSYRYTGFLLDNENGADGYGDILRLMWENEVIDQVAYDVGGDFPRAEGETLSLEEDSFDAALNDDASHWCLAYTPYGNGGDMGSPGAVNSVCLPDKDGDGYNEAIDCNDSDATVHPDATEVVGNGVDDDCDGTVDELAPVEGEVIITELMIDPSATADGDGEYIELYNLSDHDIDINGWKVHDDGAEYFVIDNPDGLVIPSHSYLVLGTNDNQSYNGHVPVDYEYGYEFELENDYDAVIIEDGSVIVDQVKYDEVQGWYIPKGRSLSLNPDKFDAFENDVLEAWCQSSTQIPPGNGTDKGTPGEPNDACE